MKQFNGFTSSTPEFQFRHSTNTFWKCAHPFLRQKIRSVFELSRKAPTPYNLFQWNVTYIKIVCCFPRGCNPLKISMSWKQMSTVTADLAEICSWTKRSQNWFEKHWKLIWKTLKIDLKNTENWSHISTFLSSTKGLWGRNMNSTGMRRWTASNYLDKSKILLRIA